ncbi:putative aminodeoxychorismate synthase [Helianthus debilis subsp. tardiflorus]
MSNGIKFLRLRWRKLDKLVAQKTYFSSCLEMTRLKTPFGSIAPQQKRGDQDFHLWVWKRRVSLEADNIQIVRPKYTWRSYFSSTTTFLEDGFFHYMNKELQSIRYDEHNYEGFPFEFHGGYIGYLGYGLKAECGDYTFSLYQ